MTLPDFSRIPRWVVIANLLVFGAAGYLIVTLGRDLTRARPLPPSPASRQSRPAGSAPAESRPETMAEEKLDQYNVIVAKHLFNPSRTEASATPAAAQAVPLPPRPVLHGIVLDGEKSRAYLEDPSTKRVLSYRVGDSVAGGQLKAIGADRVSIDRPDGQMNVMLKDPSKPAPAAAVGAQPRQAAASQRGAPPQPARPLRSGNPLAPLFQPQSPGTAPENAPVQPPPMPAEQAPAPDE
jgi:general secretion pathway protein N